MKKEIKNYVLRKHVTTSGKVRLISHHIPTDKVPNDYWSSKLADGTRIKAVSEDALYQKLYNYYKELEKKKTDYSIQSVFNRAIAYKAETRATKDSTILRDKSSFKRYISDEFSRRDIRKMTEEDLLKYTRRMVAEKKPLLSGFKKYKTVLNIIFSYALRIEKCINCDLSQHIVIGNYVLFFSDETPDGEQDENYNIFSPAEIGLIQKTIRSRIGTKQFGEMYASGYAALLAIETGMRVGELCSLKWSDIKWDKGYIHIHSQQLIIRTPHRQLELVNYTKNQRHLPPNKRIGREFPLTESLQSLLQEIQAAQRKEDIISDFVLCGKKGEWLDEDNYHRFLKRLAKKLGLKTAKNHTFRKSLNSNVLIPAGITVTERAKMLGHSVEVNMRFYSYQPKDNINNLCNTLNNFNKKNEGPAGDPSKIIIFNKEKSQFAL